MTRFKDLTLTQKGDKEKRFDKLAEEIDAAVAGDSTIAAKVEALETTVGSATGEEPSGLAKDVADLLDDVGDSTTEGTLVYDVADIKAYIAEIITANTLIDPRAEVNDGNGET